MNEIFVVSEPKGGITICAADSMDEAIHQAINYLISMDYTCTAFHHADDLVCIEFNNHFRIGAEIIDYNGEILIVKTNFFKAV